MEGWRGFRGGEGGRVDRGCLGKRDSQEKLSAKELRYLAKVEISSFSLSCSTAEEKRKEPRCCMGAVFI